MSTGSTSTSPSGVIQSGYLLVAGSAIVFSTGGLIVRLLDSEDNWTIIFWRSATACVFLLVFIALRDGRRMPGLFRQIGWPGLLVGACFASASISLVVALSLTSVAKTLMIMSGAPLVAAILGLVFLGEVIRIATWITIAAVIVGIALMVSSDQADGALLGDLFAVLIAFSIAGAIVTTRRHPGIRMAPAACVGTMMAMLIALPLASPLSVSGHDAPLLALFGAGQLGLGMALFVSGARLIPAAQSALIGMLEPILGPLWVWLAFSEQPAPLVLLGGVVVVVCVSINTFIDVRRLRPMPTR